ncbi:Vgb family protein [Nocardioides donggukensis]|uniref:PQQ-binding-like beta-propeller repeat protein n=1 Tax=Nocardioides donggukensis TaxID=2774019 RepID=A0A927Q1S3_9ACTN|nr:PQQ-binding-like beta-propeller repeat protein [Nocardioides donggukensis]MBD8869714.1 PQQ-binding-like beta-propeller repeat protein [Nocardioides donggukensis]
MDGPIRRRFSAVPALLVALALGPLAACGSDPDPDQSGTSGTPGAATADPSGPDLPPEGVEVERVGSGPVGVGDVDGEAWSVLPQTASVRPGSGPEIEVGGTPLRLVATPAGTWVSDIARGRLVRIDPDSGRVDRRVRVPPAPGAEVAEPEGLAFDGRRVWVVDQAGDRVLPLDPRSGRLGTPVPVGDGPRLVSAGASGIWVGNFLAGSVSRVTDGRARTEVVDGCRSPQGLVGAGGLVWVACTREGRVVALDPQDLSVTSTVEGPVAADAVVAEGDRVHVVGQEGPTVHTIDTGTGEVLGELTLDRAPVTRENVDAAIVGDRLVVTHPEIQKIYRVPLALLSGG